VKKYNLKAIANNENILGEKRKGMCGLPQADRIAYNQLAQYLKPHGYQPMKYTPGL